MSVPSSLSSASLDFNRLLQESSRLDSAIQNEQARFSSRPSLITPSTNGASGLSGAGGAASFRLPPLQRNLDQLSAASRRLAKQQVPPDAESDSQAQLLLSAKGIDLRKQARALRDIELSLPLSRRGGGGVERDGVRGAANIESFHPLDIERFLVQQQQLLCHSAMEEAAKVTSETYRMHDLSCLSDDWELSKREILDSFGFRAGKSALLGAGAGATTSSSGFSGFSQQRGEEEAKRKLAGMSSLEAFAPAGPPLPNQEQALYVRVVKNLNEHRRAHKPFALLQEFQAAAAEVDRFFAMQTGAASASNGLGGSLSGANNSWTLNGLSCGDVTDVWEVLRCMLNENAFDQFQSGAGSNLMEKHFAGSYNANANAIEHLKLRVNLIEGAKNYSEKLFCEFVRQAAAIAASNQNNSNSNIAALASSSLERRKQQGKIAYSIASYVNELSLRNELPPVCKETQLDGLPLWPQVYYCYRCGNVGEAIEILHKYLEKAPSMVSTRGGLGNTGMHSAHHDVSHVLVEALNKKAMKERCLPTSLWLKLHEEYQRELATAANSARAHASASAHAHVSQYIDPFKLIMYHLVGRFKLPAFFDMSQYVTRTTEDYLWLKLSVLYESGVDSSSSTSSVLDSLNMPESLREHIDLNSLSLDAFAADLLQRGEVAFNPDGRNPLMYFKVLLLSQQFERAVYHLIKTPYFSIGVHFAIALDYYGLLHTHENPSPDLLINIGGGAAGSNSLVLAGNTPSVGRVALKFSRIIRKYIESFVRTHTEESFHYLYLLHVGSDDSKEAMGNAHLNSRLRHNTMDDDSSNSVNVSDPSFPAMRDLLLETRDYDKLVGKIVTNANAGFTTGGGVSNQVATIQTASSLIYRFYTLSEAQYLLSYTAAAMKDHGLVQEAILLHLFAYQFDAAVELVLRALSFVVSSSPQNPDRLSLVELAQKIFRVVQVQSANAGGFDQRARVGKGEARGESVAALQQLLQLVNYFDFYHLGPNQYENALTVLTSQEVDLVPLSSRDIGDKVARFENSHESVRTCMSSIAVSVMDIYYFQFESIKRDLQSRFPSTTAPSLASSTLMRNMTDGRQQRLKEIRETASALMSFLGRVTDHRIEPDVLSRLLAMESQMMP